MPGSAPPQQEREHQAGLGCARRQWLLVLLLPRLLLEPEAVHVLLLNIAS